MDFKDRYGPWAIIAGASEGTGRAFARKIAAQGVNCILIARREGPLTELAAEIARESKVTCVTAAIDLSALDAFDRIVAAVGDRKVGLYISNAGADPNGAQFLDNAISNWVDIVNRNIITMMRSCHHFGNAMRARRQGGILLVGSGACYGGAGYLATYAGSKAFEMCFAEGLWAELQPFGVDVLYLVLTTTDTPAFRDLLTRKGAPIPANLANPDDVAALGLARLPHGPIRNWGQEDDVVGYAPNSADNRRARIAAIDAAMRGVFAAN
jgi:short-subunit dehydrogenase